MTTTERTTGEQTRPAPGPADGGPDRSNVEAFDLRLDGAGIKKAAASQGRSRPKRRRWICDARRIWRHRENLERPADGEGLFTFDLAFDGRE
jgi:hypothetical protein